MRDEIKSELDSLLESYGENERKGREQRKNLKSKYADFVEEFYKVREEIIWPIMMEIGRHLKSKAHDFRMEQEDDEFEPVGGKEAKICMYIYPGGEGADSSRAKDYPYISFTAKWHEHAILIHSNTCIPRHSIQTIAPLRGSSGLRGTYPADKITQEFVQEEVVKFIKEVF